MPVPERRQRERPRILQPWAVGRYSSVGFSSRSRDDTYTVERWRTHPTRALRPDFVELRRKAGHGRVARYYLPPKQIPLAFETFRKSWTGQAHVGSMVRATPRRQ